MVRKLTVVRKRAARKMLREIGFDFVGTTNGLVAALKSAGIVPEHERAGCALNYVMLQSSRIGKVGLLSPSAVAHFYKTKAWERLAASSKRRHGRRCMKCGRTPKDGVRIVSDHIVPLRQRWDLRLDPDNIQVLCDPCNWAKGSIDCTDYRAVCKDV